MKTIFVCIFSSSRNIFTEDNLNDLRRTNIKKNSPGSLVIFSKLPDSRYNYLVAVGGTFYTSDAGCKYSSKNAFMIYSMVLLLNCHYFSREQLIKLVRALRLVTEKYNTITYSVTMCSVIGIS